MSKWDKVAKKIVGKKVIAKGVEADVVELPEPEEIGTLVKKKRGRPRVKPVKEKKRIGRPNDPNKVKLKLRKELPNITQEQAKKLFEYLEEIRNDNIGDESDS